MLQQVFEYRCQGKIIALLSVRTAVHDLAEILCVQVQQWTEPGLGKQCGFNVRLPINVVVHAEEFLERPDLGVSFHVDAVDLERVSLVALLQACKQAFNVQNEQIIWEQSS